MSKKNKVKIQSVKAAKYNASNAMINYYLVLIFTAFPLFFTNKFSNIRHDKLNAFLVLSCTLVFVEFIIFIVSHFERKRVGDFPEEKWYKQLSFTDYAFGALIVLYILSTVFSKYPLESLTGTQGRNNGLLLFIVYFLIYIVISRFYYFKEYVFALAACGCLVVFLLGILNFFFIDPLGMYAGYSEKVAEDFTSTIGNKNLMSAFCCLTVPAFLLLFMNTKKSVLRYLYLVVSAVGFTAMLCADSESGFLGFVPILALTLLYYSRNVSMLRKFFVAVSAMLLCAKLLRVFSFVMQDVEKGFGTMQTLFIYNNKSFIVLAVTVLVSVGLYLMERKNGVLELPRAVPFVLIGIYALALIVLISLFVNYTFVDTESKLGGVMSFFRFDEKWGTHRGYMWIKSFEIFKTSGIKNALIGSGPDTFYSAFSPYFSELNERFGNSSTNCAHNEFLNYLITAGILGLAAYISVFVSAIIKAVKSAKENYLALVFIAPVICYFLQSVVNIATPITTPLLFVFLALSQAVARKKI